MSHFSYTLSGAAVLSAAMALYDRKTVRERIYRGAYLFGAWLLAIFGGGWMMRLINP